MMMKSDDDDDDDDDEMYADSNLSAYANHPQLKPNDKSRRCTHFNSAFVEQKPVSHGLLSTYTRYSSDHFSMFCIIKSCSTEVKRHYGC